MADCMWTKVILSSDARPAPPICDILRRCRIGGLLPCVYSASMWFDGDQHGSPMLVGGVKHQAWMLRARDRRSAHGMAVSDEPGTSGDAGRKV